MIYSIYIGGKLRFHHEVPHHKTIELNKAILDRMKRLSEGGRVVVTVDSANNKENVTFILATRKAANNLGKLL